MSATATVSRELASALGDLVLALPRHAASLMTRRSKLAEFKKLDSDPVPELQEPGPPPVALKRVILSCGDASGEGHALRLLEVLRSRHPGLEVQGFGGSRLEAAGMQVWEPLADLNVMGFKDVMAQFPLFLRCVRQYAKALQANPPDAVILMDYPGLNRHLLRIAARAGIPTVDYIAPQLWAWAPWRIRDFRKADRLLTILPFEGDWYRRRQARPTYVGHPLGDTLAHPSSEPAPSELDDPAPWVGILPGSRKREIRENLPVLLQAAARLKENRNEVRFVLPHLRESVWPLIDEHLGQSDVPVLRAPGCFHSVLQRLRAAWVASGTALLEVAAHGIPPVLVYGVSSGLTSWLAHHALAVPHIGSLNLMAGREIAPEFLGHKLDPRELAHALELRLDGEERVASLKEIARLCPHFAAAGTCTRAALAVEGAAADRIHLNKTHEGA